MSFPRRRESLSYCKYKIPHQVRNDRFGEPPIFSKVSLIIIVKPALSIIKGLLNLTFTLIPLTLNPYTLTLLIFPPQDGGHHRGAGTSHILSQAITWIFNLNGLRGRSSQLQHRFNNLVNTGSAHRMSTTF